ncbi:MAG: efflux RND transporter permease subunit [SAR324 cluster bacterium]|nr:efflux RND transporter permease subunit [SAR324 cluster bacterium]
MIEWFTKNHIAANVLMVLILGMGGYALLERIPLEVFPTIEKDQVDIRTSFRGATPGEVEEGVTIRIEEAIQDLEGIKKIQSRSSEGSASVSVEVAKGYNTRNLMDDIKERLDAVNTFPEEAERPTVSQALRRREVISVVVSGNVSEKELRRLGEQVRDDLILQEGVTHAYLESVRNYEISIEISEKRLREYGMTLAGIAREIQKKSLDLSAGSIKTQGEEILIRTKGQAYSQNDFGNIVLLTRVDGSRLLLKEIATIRDGFEEESLLTQFNNEPALEIEVFAIGNQNAITIAESVLAYIEENKEKMPEGISLGYWRDRSKIIKGRLETLTNNAIQGGILILILLALFLRPYIAFWVCLGIPISFMGGIALMPYTGITMNVMSLFAFILVLGIVVDDAIVTGENIYTHLKKYGDPLRAAIEGTQEVAVPVTFGVLTTVAAFIPLALIEGRRGAIFLQIPFIVIPVLLFSLLESKLILPAHMKHLKARASEGKDNILSRIQQRIADGLEDLILFLYRPALTATLRHRYLTASLVIGGMILVGAMISAGWMRFIFFPRIESEVARATLTMPVGTSFEITNAHIRHMTETAQQLKQKYHDPESGESVIRDIFSTTGGSGGQAHTGRVMFEITPPEQRTMDVSSRKLVNEWRQMIGEIPGVENLNFRAEIGRGGDPIDVQLTGNNVVQLKQVAEQVKLKLQDYPTVFDITDSLSKGKQELQLRVKPKAEMLGINISDMANQVRQAFLGYEVQRIQRGQEDVRVMLRYPLEERKSLESLYSMPLQTAMGVSVPFAEVAEIQSGISPSTITRINRQRTVNVTADLNKAVADIEAIKRDLDSSLTQLVLQYPGVHYSLEGEAKEQRDSFQSLWWGLLFVLFVIYALLAIPFSSYLQPFVVMSVIPLGLVGAVLGHWIMGMDLTILSLMGMLALLGVVVNDSLVMVDYINRQRKQGMDVITAVRLAGVARFRPILLTSLTTFAGLMPLILFEKSTQAQFLIPMAVSLGFGVLFATFATLIVVPINYLILEDVMQLYRKPEDHVGEVKPI